jgi:hypothetical protein
MIEGRIFRTDEHDMYPAQEALHVPVSCANGGGELLWGISAEQLGFQF